MDLEKFQSYAAPKIAKHGLAGEANSHRAPPENVSGCHTTGL